MITDRYPTDLNLLAKYCLVKVAFQTGEYSELIDGSAIMKTLINPGVTMSLKEYGECLNREFQLQEVITCTFSIKSKLVPKKGRGLVDVFPKPGNVMDEIYTTSKRVDSRDRTMRFMYLTEDGTCMSLEYSKANRISWLRGGYSEFVNGYAHKGLLMDIFVTDNKMDCHDSMDDELEALDKWRKKSHIKISRGVDKVHCEV